MSWQSPQLACPVVNGKACGPPPLPLNVLPPFCERCQLTTVHVAPASSERQTDPCAADLAPLTPSDPVWINAYMRLLSDGAIWTSILPTGGVGRPLVRWVQLAPPSLVR